MNGLHGAAWPSDAPWGAQVSGSAWCPARARRRAWLAAAGVVVASRYFFGGHRQGGGRRRQARVASGSMLSQVRWMQLSEEACILRSRAVPLCQREAGALVMAAEVEVIKMSRSEYERARDAALKELGLTYDELAAQARAGRFTSLRARKLWLAIGRRAPSA